MHEAEQTMTRRIVLDVSDLMRWQGNLSGIQRVVAEMAYRYEKKGAVFCFYIEETQQFYALNSYSDFMAERNQAVQQTAVKGSSLTNAARSAKDLTKKIGRNITPPGVAKAVTKLRSSSAAQVKTTYKETHERFAFHDDDILMIFGAHWDKPHYTTRLRELKEQYGLFVTHLINDLIPVFDRAHVAEVEHVRFPKYMAEISEISDLIYLESASTARDFEQFTSDIKLKKMPHTERMTLGENIQKTEPRKPSEIKADERYLLAVGTIEVRKNHALLYSAYKRAHEKGIELPRLIMVGRRGWLSDDIYYQMVHDSDVNQKLVFKHDADDQQLTWLYQNCLFVVFPSYYEGWGLPVAEAAHHGKATAASNRSSIPEVVGDAAVYFSANSADECLEAILSLLNDKKRATYEQKIANRKPWTWDQTFEQTWQGLERALTSDR